jgi:hypothetical protein
MVPTPSYLVLVSREQPTEFWKVWIDFNKNGVLKQMKKWYQDHLQVALPFQVPLQYLLLLYLV